MTLAEEAALLHDEIEKIVEECESGDFARLSSIKVKIARLRQILVEMT